MDIASIPAEIRRVLESYRFDSRTFETLTRKLRDGAIGGGADRITGDVVSPPEDAWRSLPEPGSKTRAAVEEVGRAAIERGAVGMVVLNGGMATRFGGVVKCGVEALDGRSFLDLKLADVGTSGRGKAWTLLMNSFATHETTVQLLEGLSQEGPVRTFTQGVMPRVTETGEVFVDGAGRPSLAATGHGDLGDSLRASGALAKFREGGGEVLLMANVDNLAATLDPAIVGAHIDSGAEMTVEVVAKEPGDAGGAPAFVDGRLQIVEGFRFPAGFDQDAIPVFNTNTIVFDARALDRDHPLTWFAVRKKVDGRPAVQFERLAGELSALLETRYLLLPREGPEGRFLPAKDPDELRRRRPAIRELLRCRGIIP